MSEVRSPCVSQPRAAPPLLPLLHHCQSALLTPRRLPAARLQNEGGQPPLPEEVPALPAENGSAENGGKVCAPAAAELCGSGGGRRAAAGSAATPASPRLQNAVLPTLNPAAPGPTVCLCRRIGRGAAAETAAGSGGGAAGLGTASGGGAPAPALATAATATVWCGAAAGGTAAAAVSGGGSGHGSATAPGAAAPRRPRCVPSASGRRSWRRWTATCAPCLPTTCRSRPTRRTFSSSSSARVRAGRHWRQPAVPARAIAGWAGGGWPGRGWAVAACPSHPPCQHHCPPCSRPPLPPPGPLNDIKIITDKTTGRSKGFAYVEFQRKEDVINALALTGQVRWVEWPSACCDGHSEWHKGAINVRKRQARGAAAWLGCLCCAFHLPVLSRQLTPLCDLRAPTPHSN